MKNDNDETEAVLEGPCPRMVSSSPALEGCCVMTARLRIAYVEDIVVKAVRCLYRTPHAAASSAQERCSRKGGVAEAAMRLFVVLELY